MATNSGTNYEPRQDTHTFLPSLVGLGLNAGTFTSSAPPNNSRGYWTKHNLNGASIVDFDVLVNGTLSGATTPAKIGITTNLPQPKWVDDIFRDVEATGLIYAGTLRARLNGQVSDGNVPYTTMLTLEQVGANGAPPGGGGTVYTGPTLGAATTFGILAGSAVTNTGLTVVNGDLGLSPGSSVTGFPPGVVTGTIHIGDSAAVLAQTALTATYLDLEGRTPTANLSGTDLSAVSPLAPGIYKFNTSAALTGALVLDAAGDPNAVWIFQIGSTLTVSVGSVVTVINSGTAGNVFWQVGSSATINGPGTTFLGNIVALTSITLGGGILNGSALARNGAVTIAAAETITTVPNSSLDPSTSPDVLVVNGAIITRVHGTYIAN